MSAAKLSAALGGRRIGRAWMARCPSHDDQNPSLAIAQAENGRILIKCHAGCDQATIIEELQARGLWVKNRPCPFMRPAPRAAAPRKPNRDDAKRTEAARAIWQAARSANNTLIETYLASRGLHLPPPPTLRFQPGLKHPSGGIWPAMVALVTRGWDDTPLAIHRTFLACDGGSKAAVSPEKMMLGPCRGGAVRLAAAAEALMNGGDRELPLRHAGDRPPGMGGSLGRRAWKP